MRILLFFILFAPLLWAEGIVSAYAVNMKTGGVVLDTNRETSVIPGSCLKIATTGAALHLLGPESHFYTTLEIDGEIEGGILHGNVWICGGGDPCLGSDRVTPSLSWNEQLSLWADEIGKLGIREIRGRVIADATRWEKAQAVPSWLWEDLGNYYGAGASALTFHENSYTVDFAPGEREGDPAPVIRTTPMMVHRIQSEVTTGPVGSGDQACIYGTEYALAQVIRGTVPAGVKTFSIRGAIPDAAFTCGKLLTRVLEQRDVRVSHENLQGVRRAVHTRESPDLKSIVYWTNQKSINLYAEHLLKKLGEQMLQDGSTVSGVKATMDFWRTQGVELTQMADGSGLSRKNLASAQQLVGILLKMAASPHFAVFFDSLPEIKEGVKAKLGGMSLVGGYVGYKGDIAFAIIVNNEPDRAKIRQTLHSLIDGLR